MTLEELQVVASQMATVLAAMPCRCQMKGGVKWHLQARTEVEKQCSQCKALAAYRTLTHDADTCLGGLDCPICNPPALTTKP